MRASPRQVGWLFVLVKGCKTNDYEDGDAGLAWKRLTQKYASKNTVSLLKLKREFTNSSMKVDQDPDEWITELEELQTRIAEIAGNNKKTVHISDDDLMIHVLNYLPRKYDIEKHDCEKELEAGKLDMTKLREALGSRFAIEFDEEEDHQETEERALFAKQFKDQCNYCGKWGHKAADCREKKKNEGGGRSRTTLTCNYCGKTGHKEKDCWKKKRDERASIATSEDQEVVLVSLEETPNCSSKFCKACKVHERYGHNQENCMKKNIEDWVKVSEEEDSEEEEEEVLVELQPSEVDSDLVLMTLEGESEFALKAATMTDLWIGDTGASCHLVTKDDGLINVKTINKKIKFGDGSILNAVKVGDLPVIVEQRSGKKVKATLENVKVVPNMICNLFSILSCLKKGWNIGNEKRVLKLTKGKAVIKFDQQLETKTGFLAGVKMSPCLEDVELPTNEANINILHQKLGQCCEAITQATAKKL